jgi:excisionase family DNA binding protein
MATAAPSQSLLLSRKEVANLLSCCERHVFNLARRGELRELKLGTAPRYERAEVEALIRRLRGDDGTAASRK